MNLPPPAYIGKKNKFLCLYFLVGDEGLSLKHYLMRPYKKFSLDLESIIFNYRWSRARRTIENSFGILARISGAYSENQLLEV